MKNNDVKLYNIKSGDCTVAYGGRIYEGVTIKWFVYGRKEPVIPYEIGIQDYIEDASEGLSYAQEALNELFAVEEAGILQDYLIGKGMKCQIEERELPLPNNVCGYLGFYDAAGMHIEGLMEIYKGLDYALPFKVMGFFSMDSSTSWKTCVYGSYFMEAFLEKMQIPCDKNRLMDILKELHDEGWKIDISFPSDVFIHETANF